jgi:AraC family transcriptional activator of pobA
MKEAPIIPMQKFQDKGLPFKINTIRGLRHEGDDIYTLPHSNDYYEMIWVTNGSGVLKADLQEYAIGNNLLYCLKPGQVHQLATNEEADGYILSFGPSFLSILEHEFDWTCQASLFQLFAGHHVTIQGDSMQDLKEIALKMMTEFDHQYSFRTQLLKKYFKIFLIYLSRQFEENLQVVKQTREMELVNSFLEMLDKKFKDMKMVADYATQLSVTPNYLNGIIKKNTGISAGQHIRQRVVLEAKRMARYSEAGMKEIAYSLGFSDSGHFSKFFKTVSGKNFSDFKKEGPGYSMFLQQGLSA